MSDFFIDSSALAKRYLPEQGTNWLRKQIASANTVIVSWLTSVEGLRVDNPNHYP